MDSIILQVEPRELGKKGTKAVRNAGNVPCVLYGHKAEPVHFQASVLSMNPLIYTHETHVVEINLDGKKWSCILRAIDFNPVTDVPAHADFQLLTAGEKIRMNIPVRYIGIPAGQVEGGITQVILTEVEIECLPKDIPSHLEIDISELTIGDTLHVSDLKYENIAFLTSLERTIVTVAGAKEEEEPEEDLLLEGLEGEEGAEGEDGEGASEDGEGASEDEKG